MTENKLYAQCREEAIEELQNLFNKSYYEIIHYNGLDVAQLTAEIYGMKLLEMSQSSDNTNWFSRSKEEWHCILDGTIIGTTQQLHAHFVEQFNKENN